MFGILAMTCVPLDNALAANPSEGGKPRAQTPRKEVHSAMDKYLGGIDLKVAISPITPKEGIETGLVIAYGHLIRPPYYLEYRDKNLFLNGVQVEPSIIEQRRKEKMAPFIETAKKKMQGSRDVRDHLTRMLKDGRSRDQVMQFVNSHRDVIEHARWADEGSMLVKMTGGTYEVIGKFRLGKQGKKPPPPATIPTPQEIKERRLSEINSSLQRGECLVFLSSGGTYKAGDIRKAVVEIMRDDTLARDEKLERLRERVFPGSETPAFDLLENFDLREWLPDSP